MLTRISRKNSTRRCRLNYVSTCSHNTILKPKTSSERRKRHRHHTTSTGHPHAKKTYFSRFSTRNSTPQSQYLKRSPKLDDNFMNKRCHLICSHSLLKNYKKSINNSSNKVFYLKANYEILT